MIIIRDCFLNFSNIIIRVYIFIDKGLADVSKETTPVRLYYPWGTGFLHNAGYNSNDGTLTYSYYGSGDGAVWIEAKYRLFAVTL